MCILSWSGPVRRLLMALKSKMPRSSCRYTSTESMISTRNTDKHRLAWMGFLAIWQPLEFQWVWIVPLKGLNLFSRSNSCLPSLDKSMRRSGQMAYSSSVRLTWWILSITVSGEGPIPPKGTHIRDCNRQWKNHKTSTVSLHLHLPHWTWSQSLRRGHRGCD